VADGQFSYAVPHPNIPGNPTPAFPATFAADGRFSGQIIWGMPCCKHEMSGGTGGRCWTGVVAPRHPAR
jgi:hypothetical protein